MRFPIPADFAPPSVAWESLRFHPVIALPDEFVVDDFTLGYDPDRTLLTPWVVGRYNERRRGMYTSALFTEGGVRDVHVGVDLGAPVGTPVSAFADGEVVSQGYNPAAGDYGHVVVTAHRVDGHALYALHGHLAAASITLRAVGDRFVAGAVLGYVGDRHENGGWNPHLHFQLSWIRPETHDLPGAVSIADRDRALGVFPDPRNVLGELWRGDAFG